MQNWAFFSTGPGCTLRSYTRIGVVVPCNRTDKHGSCTAVLMWKLLLSIRQSKSLHIFKLLHKEAPVKSTSSPVISNYVLYIRKDAKTKVPWVTLFCHSFSLKKRLLIRLWAMRSWRDSGKNGPKYSSSTSIARGVVFHQSTRRPYTSLTSLKRRGLWLGTLWTFTVFSPTM